MRTSHFNPSRTTGIRILWNWKCVFRRMQPSRKCQSQLLCSSAHLSECQRTYHHVPLSYPREAPVDRNRADSVASCSHLCSLYLPPLPTSSRHPFDVTSSFELLLITPCMTFAVERIVHIHRYIENPAQFDSLER